MLGMADLVEKICRKKNGRVRFAQWLSHKEKFETKKNCDGTIDLSIIYNSEDVLSINVNKMSKNKYKLCLLCRKKLQILGV